MAKKRVMQHLTAARDSFRNFAGKAGLLSAVVGLSFWISGCGSGTTSSTPVAATQGPQIYLAPYVVGASNGDASSSAPLFAPQTYAIDDSADQFSQTLYPLAPQVINAGTTSAMSRGLLGLEITANYTETTTGTYIVTDIPTETPQKFTSFAVELAGQAGGLVQLVGQPVAPLVAATQCPNQATPQTYQFLTIPVAQPVPAGSGIYPSWDPSTQTAYGSVDISSSGSTITFKNIQQFTLAGGSPATLAASPATGVCGSTYFGNTISTPNIVITAPSSTGQGSTSPQATIGIGPTGLLVEDNAEGAVPTLGAGTGAVGLPQPSSPLSTSALSALVGAQYLGFVYGAGVFASPGEPPTWTSRVASFGFPSPPSCPPVPASTSTSTSTSNLIYGGDFTNDDPTTGTNGFGNCDLAIALGIEDPANNGLFPNANVWIGGSYAGHTIGQNYWYDSFSAVAIAGQLNGQNVVFLLGVDSTQPWEIYLLQSN
jgi:hypothetical protein